MYQDYKPCEVCGSEVRLRTDSAPGVRDPDGPVEERVCTNSDCDTNLSD